MPTKKQNAALRIRPYTHDFSQLLVKTTKRKRDSHHKSKKTSKKSKKSFKKCPDVCKAEVKTEVIVDPVMAEFERIVVNSKDSILAQLNNKFKKFKDNGADASQTEYLKSSGPFTSADNSDLTGFRHEYTWNLPQNNKMVLLVGPRTFEIQIAQHDSTGANNVSVSFDRSHKMYMYGIKTNDAPRLSGNSLNNIMFALCRAMHIKEVYISDQAGVSCFWDKDIQLNHFSILRVIAGKNTFYESLDGRFKDPIAAQHEKELIRKSISPTEKAEVMRYLKFTGSGNCHGINDIIEKAFSAIGHNANAAMFKYIMTPFTGM